MKLGYSKWIIAVSYTALIYLSLPFMRGILNYTREFFGGTGAFSVAVNTTLALAAFGAVLILINLRAGILRFAVFFLFAAAVIIIAAKKLDIPEERIHFIQYGLCGYLYMNAALALSAAVWKKVSIAIAVTVLAGIGDELIQGILPSRVYDIRDIYFNSFAGVSGVILRKWIFSRK
ncbi:MAG: VanZ family protein [Elusimicrobia bacterium]|nr:VanZ family protein [Elusimicrobiota bacterium]